MLKKCYYKTLNRVVLHTCDPFSYLRQDKFTRKVMINIRKEQPADELFIRNINISASEQNAEADIVDELRKNCKDFISLVALEGEKIVGHILFTPIVIECIRKQTHGMGLAPMAVIPEYQKKGIGSKLVIAELENMKYLNILYIIVLGHPAYYPKFGFEIASKYNIKSEYDSVPDETFMILILNKDKMTGIKGDAKHRPGFAAAI